MFIIGRIVVSGCVYEWKSRIKVIFLIRHKFYRNVNLSLDHRVIDGAVGA